MVERELGDIVPAPLLELSELTFGWFVARNAWLCAQ